MPRLRRPWLVVLPIGALSCVLAVWLLRRMGAVGWIEGSRTFELTQPGVIDARAAERLFELQRIGRDYVYDPVALLVNRPDQRTEWPWPEAPGGKIRIWTNALGLREDEPTLPEKSGVRILVAGDSHTSGLIDNALSFANLLEKRLQALSGHEKLEVLNAGVGYTGPYCYRGMLEKHLDLHPDVFVAVLYTGNDFWDDFRLRLALRGRRPPWPDADYRAHLARAYEHGLASSSQGYNQAYRFKHYPAEPEQALADVIESFLSMRDRCAELGIAFLAVVLPTKMDVEPEDDGATLELVRRELGLSPEEAALPRTLGRRFAEAMAAAGVQCLDPFESMRAAPHPLYWHEDYHLGGAGHALLAELLFEELQARL